MGWGEHNADVHVGCERFFRPTYHTLVDDWIPALDGVVDKLATGATSPMSAVATVRRQS